MPPPWCWFHYLEELGCLERAREDVESKTGRKDYVLTERGEKLLAVLEEVWSEDALRKVSDIYQRRREKTFQPDTVRP